MDAKQERLSVTTPTDSREYVQILHVRKAEIDAFVVLRRASVQSLGAQISIQQRAYLKGVINALSQLILLKTHGLVFDMAPGACSFKRLIESEMIQGGRDELWGAHTQVVLFSPKPLEGFSAEIIPNELVRRDEEMLKINLESSANFSVQQAVFLARFRQIQSEKLCITLSDWRNGYLAHVNSGFIKPDYVELCSHELLSYCERCLATVGDFFEAVRPSVFTVLKTPPWTGVMDYVAPTVGQQGMQA